MTSWDKFFDEKIRMIARLPASQRGEPAQAGQKNILDIGGGFRFQKGLLKYKHLFEKTNYRTLDVDPKYQPDIVGDIQDLPLSDESADAIICKAVLEHVPEPQQAVQELYRVLKKGGFCLAYVPFLYPYHACEGKIVQKNGYKDYYRYTPDAIRYLFRKFRSIEICPVRGNLETVFNLTPLRRLKFFLPLVRFLDRFFSGQQASGYNIFLIK